nr:MAG TPA: hypothetical protein [Caudoviricetes sp.]DAQ94864.1 MAG TPA: hypothetical protein [Caudoviricetes sp.]
MKYHSAILGIKSSRNGQNWMVRLLQQNNP